MLILGLEHLSDDELIAGLDAALRGERIALTEVVRHLAEFDRRRLYAPLAYPSTFEYCTRKYGLTEAAAYRRIYAARASRKYPVVLDLIRESSFDGREPR